MALNRWLTDEEYARAAANGINRKRLQSRVYDFDWDVEEAITAPIGTVSREYERKHGDWFKVAAENGINISTFYNRINVLGWSYKDAATKPTRRKEETEKAWLNIAKGNGIGYQTFISRIRTRKWDIERAATTPVINTGRRCSMKDKGEVS